MKKYCKVIALILVLLPTLSFSKKCSEHTEPLIGGNVVEVFFNIPLSGREEHARGALMPHFEKINEMKSVCEFISTGGCEAESSITRYWCTKEEYKLIPEMSCNTVYGAVSMVARYKASEFGGKTYQNYNANGPVGKKALYIDCEEPKDPPKPPPCTGGESKQCLDCCVGSSNSDPKEYGHTPAQPMKQIGGSTGDPVATYTGQVYQQRQDFSLETPGFTFLIEPYYLASKKTQGVLGYNWSTVLEVHVFKTKDGKYILRDKNGFFETFSSIGVNETKYLNGFNLEIVTEDNVDFYYYNTGSKIYEFDNLGNLSKIKDRSGKGVEFKYAEDVAGNLIDLDSKGVSATATPADFHAPVRRDNKVIEVISLQNAAHKITVAYNSNGLVESLTNHLNEKVKYSYDLAGNLTEVIDAAGAKFLYKFNTNNIHQLDSSFAMPFVCEIEAECDAGPWIKQTYFDNGRVATQEYDKVNLSFSDQITTSEEVLLGGTNKCNIEVLTSSVTKTQKGFDGISSIVTTYIDSAWGCTEKHPIYREKKFRVHTLSEGIESYDETATLKSFTNIKKSMYNANGKKVRNWGTTRDSTVMKRDGLGRIYLKTVWVFKGKDATDNPIYEQRKTIKRYIADTELVAVKWFVVDDVLKETTIYPYVGVPIGSTDYGSPEPEGTIVISQFGPLLLKKSADRLLKTLDDASQNYEERKWEYDATTGYLNKEINFSGVAYVYSYAGSTHLGKPTKKIWPDASEELYEYNAKGELSQKTTRKGLIITYTYNAYGDILTECKGDEIATICRENTYEANRLVRSIQGKTTPQIGVPIIRSYSYTTFGRLDTTWQVLNETDSVVIEINTYDSHGNLERVEDVLRNSTKTDVNYKHKIKKAYNLFNQERYHRDSKNKTTYKFYDKWGNVRFIKDAAGNKTKREFDSRGNILKEWNAFALATGSTNTNPTVYTYDYKDRLLTVTNPESQTITYTYDKLGNRLTSTNSASGAIITWTYVKNQLTKEVSAEGLITLYFYNSNGQLHKQVQKNSTTTNVIEADDFIREFIYDVDGNQTVIKEGRTGSMVTLNTKVFDTFGRLSSETSSNGITQTYTYYPTGNVKSITSSNGQVIEYTYNAFGSLLTQSVGETPAANEVLTTELVLENKYDIVNRLESRHRVGLGRDTILYNSNDFVTQVKDSSGLTQYFTPNNLNQIHSQIIGNNNKVYSYDGLGRVKQFTDAGKSIYTEYTSLGQVFKIKDHNNNETKYFYEYKTGERRDSVMYPDDTWEVSVYDMDNRLTEKKDKRNSNELYYYNNRGLLDSIKVGTHKKVFGYDTRNRLSSVAEWQGVNKLSEIVVILDNSSRPTSVTQSLGVVSKTVAYSYNDASKEITVTAPNGSVSIKSYNERNQLSTLKFDGADVVTLSYEASRLLSKSFGNGIVETIGSDKSGKLLSKQMNLVVGETSILKYDYYQFYKTDESNLEWISRPKLGSKGSRSTWNTANALQNNYKGSLGGYANGTKPTSISPTSGNFQWSFDDRGNPNIIRNYTNGQIDTYTDNEANEITTLTDKDDNVTNFTYDDIGNLTQDGTYNYYWSEEGRLDSIRLKNLTTRILHLKYDALGRRIQKIAADKSVFYTYDGWQVIQEDVSYTSGTTATRNYVYGSYIDEPLMMQIDSAGTKTKFYFGQTTNYNTEVVFDESGEVVERYEIEPFGEFKIYDGMTTNELTTSKIGNEYVFQGRRFDSESGLYYFRYRYYSPKMERFISRDPLRLTNGVDPINMYRFVENNPTALVDPYGLFASAVVAGVPIVLVTVPVVIDYFKRNPIDLDISDLLIFTPIIVPTISNYLQDRTDENVRPITAPTNKDVHNICDQKTPKGLNQCELAKWQVKKWKDCIKIRIEHSTEVYGSIDPTHQQHLQNPINKLNKAKRSVKQNCKKPKPICEEKINAPNTSRAR